MSMFRSIKELFWRRAEVIHMTLQNRVHARYVNQFKAQYNIHPSVRIGFGSEVYGTGRISIGERTYMGPDCYIQCDPETCSIQIGKCCAIAYNVHIRTTSFRRSTDFADSLNSGFGDSKSIVIGDYVWIGVHVYIRGGVTIGNNSIIGANSVVTRDVPANSVVGGAPARLIHDKSVYAQVKT